MDAVPAQSDELAALRGKARAVLLELGARPELLDERGLPLFADATELAVAHVSQSGREHRLVPDAAAAWRRLRAAAERDGVTVLVISGFRSFERQREILAARAAAGAAIEELLTVLAPPGSSEHHTGRAVDIGTPGCEPLSEAFCETDAFRWLSAHAAEFGFTLSYPRDNRHGYRYEPWHWCWR